MKSKFSLFLWITILFIAYSCTTDIPKHATIYIIPVYGQSLALGEEATLVTNFDSLKNKNNHRIRTELLDEEFGYFSNTRFKQYIKRLLKNKKRTFEVSCYGIGEYLCQALDDSIYICTFPAGQGATGIEGLSKGTPAYNKLIKQIINLQDIAERKELNLSMPAFCWHQGENDVVWNTNIDYKYFLEQFRLDLEQDVQTILHTNIPLACILYQTNCLSISKDSFDMNLYECPQTKVPMAQLKLIKDNPHFHASSPVYPYNVVREYVHIDGVGQKQLGYMEGIAIDRLLNGEKNRGLIPNSFITQNDTIVISFNIPYPPLTLDTTQVCKIEHYGFSVITPNDKNILKKCWLNNNKIHLLCDTLPINAKIRYAVNGEYGKSGYINGPRGNLRDSQGDSLTFQISQNIYPLHNWCYMFEMVNKHY